MFEELFLLEFVLMSVDFDKKLDDNRDLFFRQRAIVNMLLVVEDFTQKISFKVMAETSVDTGCIVIVADIITSSWQYPIIKDLFEMLF